MGSFKYQLMLLFAIFGPPLPTPDRQPTSKKNFEQQKNHLLPPIFESHVSYHLLKKISSESVLFDFFLLKKSKSWIIYPNNFNCVLLLSLNHVLFSVFSPLFSHFCLSFNINLFKVSADTLARPPPWRGSDTLARPPPPSADTWMTPRNSNQCCP